MKKIKLVVILTLLFLTLGCGTALANDWTIEVNGKQIEGEVKIIDGRSLIPLRAVGEALGLEVTYYDSTRVIGLEAPSYKYTAVVWIDYDDNDYEAIILGLESDGTERFNLDVNGYKMHVQPVNIDGRVYVPVRLICSSFGAPIEVTGTRISIGSIFTDTEYSVKNISDLIYSENAVLYIPEKATQTVTNSTENKLSFLTDEGEAVLNVARRIVAEEEKFSSFTSATVAKSAEYNVIYVEMKYQVKGSYDVLVDKTQQYYVINNKVWAVNEYEDLDSLNSYEEQRERAYSALDFSTDVTIMFKTGQYLKYDGSSIMKALGY